MSYAKEVFGSASVQYPWRSRIAWECRGYMYYVDACEAECLDVARGLWLTGADYVSVYIRGEHATDMGDTWRYLASRGVCRGSHMGGYSQA